MKEWSVRLGTEYLPSAGGGHAAPKQQFGSVQLGGGEEEERFPEKGTLSELFSFHGLVKYVCTHHTFFHGKVGFYGTVMGFLSSLEEEEGGKLPGEVKYVYTSRNLPRKQDYRRVILLPKVASQEALNVLIAKCLNLGVPIWVVAHPMEVYPPLLMSFHNFFISVHSEEEMEGIRKVLDFPARLVSLVQKRPSAIFATDYPPAVKMSGSTVAIARIDW